MQIARGESPSFGRLDVVIIIFLSILAYFISVGPFPRHNQTGGFYQQIFGPAVSLACGSSFSSVEGDGYQFGSGVGTTHPQLTDFLFQRQQEFDCEHFPKDAARKPLDAFQTQSMYLLLSAAAVWVFTGVSWQALNILTGVLAAAFIVSVFAVSRLFLPAPLSAAAAVLAFLSPANLFMVPHLRDYVKAPFLLLHLFFCGYLLLNRESLPRVCAAAALAGLTAGIGFGFRADLVSALPFFGITLAIGLFSSTQRRLTKTGAALGLFAGAFIFSSLPVILSYK